MGAGSMCTQAGGSPEVKASLVYRMSSRTARASEKPSCFLLFVLSGKGLGGLKENGLQVQWPIRRCGFVGVAVVLKCHCGGKL